jgi:ribosome-binding protein aMBF1 (putative translation factor)
VGEKGTFNISARNQFKSRALARSDVRKAYDDLAEEFVFLDEVLKARAWSGLTQAEVAARIGMTQSAIARLESAEPKHSPSIAALQKYAKALGYKVEIRLIKNLLRRTRGSTAHTAKAAMRRSA